MRFEIVTESSQRTRFDWSKLGAKLLPLFAKGRELLDDVYVSAAKSMLECKEDLEDRLAERKACDWIRARSLKTAKPDSKTRLSAAGTGIADSPDGHKPA